LRRQTLEKRQNHRRGNYNENTNGVRQSKGHRQYYAGRPNIRQTRRTGLSTGQRRPTGLCRTKICPFLKEFSLERTCHLQFHIVRETARA
jgi:hypothetical protein